MATRISFRMAMVFWFIPVVLVVGYFAWLLVKALKQYEKESAMAALEKAAELENRLNLLQKRVSILETLESDALLEVDNSIEMPDSADSLSLKARPSPTGDI